MKILKIDDPTSISEALKILNKGGIVIYPTETCYGVGVDALNPNAVSKVLEYKHRPSGKAISIAVSSKEMAENFVELNTPARDLYKNFLPGPVTLISQSKHIGDKRLEAENGTLGIRIPNYKFLLGLIKQFGKPITSTSANSAGKKTPYKIEDILDNLSEKQKSLVDLIIDAGELPHNSPSTVIDTTGEELVIHRQGRLDPSKTKEVSQLISQSEEETIASGEKLIKDNQKNLKDSTLLILLNGELGAGKTQLTKGIAKGLGLSQIVKSPTYNYVNEYRIGSGTLYHFDAWRIQSIEDLNFIGFHNWFKLGNVIIIEWPSVVMNLDEKFFEKLSYLYVDFVVLDDSKREIRVYELNINI